MECLDNEQNIFEFLDADAINDLVFTSETLIKDEPPDVDIEGADNETVEEKPITFVVVNDSESVIENPPDFLSSSVEDAVQDDVEEGGDQQDLNTDDQV